MDETQTYDHDRIRKINIEDEMKSSYIDYSMSVIVARALPDVRDGFKPVHRRILYGMRGIGNTSTQPYKKCARVVGEVLGKYHPHGDSSVYGALVRLAQDWNMRYTLVDGQGNFGSVDGDSAAAMRYTECRLSKMGEHVMDDLDKDTVDMVPNFDDTDKEPSVMPTKVPNLLVNGANGIAVGMATNIPTHNLGEVIDGCCAYIDNPDIDVEGLMQYIKAPDFPTGAFIYGLQGVREAYETGRGRIVMRARAEIESGESHDKIVITEIPYGVNKALLTEGIWELVKEGKLDGISHVNDETGRQGMRIVVDVRREANANVVLNKLFKMTALQSSFSVNCIALVKGRPRLLTLRDCVKCFVEHRHDVTIRRTQFELKKAQDRAHLLEALIVACDNIDEVVHIIRGSKNPTEAQQKLMERFSFDEVQAKYVVEMRLSQLTGLQQEKLHTEFDELMKTIEYLQSILADPELCKKVMKEELLEVKEKYGDERRTEIKLSNAEFNPEDYYANDPVVITMSHLGYIKRTLQADFRTQGRGGTGSRGSRTREQDFTEFIYAADAHDVILFFTKKGRVYQKRCYEIPEGAKDSKGRAIQNLLELDADDSINNFLGIQSHKFADEEFKRTHFVVFATKNGTVKRTALTAYNPHSKGIRAINVAEGDEVVNVVLTNGHNELILASRNGRACRFDENDIRPMARTATGVRGMTLDDEEDAVIGMVVAYNPEQSLMVVSEKGYGKRSKIGVLQEMTREDGSKYLKVEDGGYRLTRRGSKGVTTLNITERTGKVIAVSCVTGEEDLMIINKSGVTIRFAIADVGDTKGRNTQGVKLIELKKRNDSIASVCLVPHEESEENDAADAPDAVDAADVEDVEDVNNENINNEDINKTE